MVTRIQLLTWLFVGFGMTNFAVAAVPVQQVTVSSLQRDQLVDRFDRDGDGQLNQSERAALRDAFGGIDVPMLPTQQHNYEELRLPAHIDASDLMQSDNTPADNALTNAGATLGRVLFYDRQLSRNNTIACASCHPQQAAFSDTRRFSIGFQRGQTTRNGMALANVRFTNLRGRRPGFFWDERAETLERQALMPIQDAIEMGMALDELEARLQKLPYYPALFEAAFGTPAVTSDRIARALAQFMRSMVSFDSKFDRSASRLASAAPAAREPTNREARADAGRFNYSLPFDDFTEAENLGKSLFVDGVDGVLEFGCAFCHMPPTFGMPKSMNNGLDLNYADRGLGALDRPSNDPLTPSNDGKFKSPSLRNVALTAPYMHDGRFPTLEAVIDHYSGGMHPHPNLALPIPETDRSQPTSGFKFTAEQKAALVAFLKTLSDERFVSDPKFSDPFVRGEPTESPAERFARLVKEHEDGASPRELAPQFLALAEEHAQDPVAIDALVWVLTRLRTRPDAVRAVALLEKNHLRSERLEAACAALAKVPALRAEQLLEKLFEKNPHRNVRAHAGVFLAEMLDAQTALVEELKRDPAADRLLQFYGKDYGKRIAELDESKLTGKREQLYARLSESFGDVAVKDSTVGRLAERALVQIRHLSIGRVAPEIEGEDISGERFKLSDYRGKVVVLSFWGDW